MPLHSFHKHTVYLICMCKRQKEENQKHRNEADVDERKKSKTVHCKWRNKAGRV